MHISRVSSSKLVGVEAFFFNFGLLLLRPGLAIFRAGWAVSPFQDLVTLLKPGISAGANFRIPLLDLN